MVVGLADAKTRLALPGAMEWIDANENPHTGKLARGALRILRETSIADEVGHSRVVGDDLAEITCPLLAVYGDESGLCDQAPELEALLPQCRTVVLPEQGHSVLVERPAEVRDHVLDWVRGHSLAGAAR
jgi:pimeloyl-ACP methyl ester carboxylesterase